MNRGALVVGIGSLVATGIAGFFLTRKKVEMATPSPVPTTSAPVSTPTATQNYPLSMSGNIFDTVSNSVMTLINEPRGIRNNNPLNIKWSSVNNWNGQTGKDNGGFSIFDNPVNGIRAAARILKNYRNRGVNTLREIITEWTRGDDPAMQQSYINHVSSVTKISQDGDVPASRYLDLLRVMILHENGKNPYTDSQILAGINAA